MPNHVINEVIFRDLSKRRREAIFAKVIYRDGSVDFSILRPDWGAKWNPFEGSATSDDKTLTMRFQTLWVPPYGWLESLFKFFRVPFEYRWLSQGHVSGKVGLFDSASGKWIEREADDTTQRHLHKLLWGVESFGKEATNA